MVHEGSARDYELPQTAPFHNEGKTVAGWVMFWGICLGALVIALGVVLWQLWVVVAGIAVTVITIVVSRVLSGMGMGQPRSRDHAPGAGEPNWYS